MLKKLLVLILLSCMIFQLTACFGPKKVYSDGRDTIKSWGDGSFQLLKGQKSNCLSFEKYNTILLNNVEEYIENNEHIYLYGLDNKGYTSNPQNYHVFVILNIQTNKFKLCAETQDEKPYYFTYDDEIIANGDGVIYSSLEMFSEEELSVFQSMKAAKPYLENREQDREKDRGRFA